MDLLYVMWLLILIFLATPERAEQRYLLIKQDTQAECERLKEWVINDMKWKYPGESQYKVVCEIEM